MTKTGKCDIMEILLLTPGQEQPITSWLAPADKNFLSPCEGLLRQNNYRIYKSKRCAFPAFRYYLSKPVFLKTLRSFFFFLFAISITSLSVIIIAYKRGFVNPLVQLLPNNICSGYLRSFSARKPLPLPRCDRSKWGSCEKDRLG